jgi:hypothetical protein
MRFEAVLEHGFVDAAALLYRLKSGREAAGALIGLESQAVARLEPPPDGGRIETLGSKIPIADAEAGLNLYSAYEETEPFRVASGR